MTRPGTIIAWVAVLLLGLGAVLGIRWLFGSQAIGPEAVVVRIPPGTGAREAATILEEKGILRSALAFRFLAFVTSDARRLQAGEYLLEGAVSPRDILQKMVQGDIVLHPVTVPEGLNLTETLDLLATSGLEIQGDLGQEAHNPAWIADADPEATDLEGYLFPDTYRFPRGVEAKVVIGRLVQRYREVADALGQEIGHPPEGTRAWVTLASLVEKETSQEAERTRVAAVFANRLEIGMPLQCDPTVIYALQHAGVELEGSLAHYLNIDHAYNTYRYRGLPPGPIANPGEASLRAALQPASTDDLYFVADGTGGHRFSRNLEEHNRAVREWKRTVQGESRN